MLVRYAMGERSGQWEHAYTQRFPQIPQPFTLVSFGDYRCDADYFTEREGMDQFLMLYTVSGTGKLQYGQHTALLQPGQFAVIHCQQYQHYRTHTPEGWHFFWIHFRSSVAEPLVEALHTPALQVVSLAQGVFEEHFTRLQTLVEKVSLCAETEISLQLHTLLHMALQQKEQAQDGGAQHHRQDIEQVKAYIRAHFMQPLTTEQLAAVASISPYYFIRLFKQYTGVTPHHYLLITRIEAAKRLLWENDAQVADIAEQTGFGDAKNLIAQFKRLTGYTPMQFRKTQGI